MKTVKSIYFLQEIIWPKKVKVIEIIMLDTLDNLVAGFHMFPSQI